jgi:hypothetical protein
MINPDFIKPADDNLYKYIVIIGLAMLLVSPLINGNIKDAHLKVIELDTETIKAEEITKLAISKTYEGMYDFNGNPIKSIDRLEEVLSLSENEFANIRQEISQLKGKNDPRYFDIVARVSKLGMIFGLSSSKDIFSADYKDKLIEIENRMTSLIEENQVLKMHLLDLQGQSKKLDVEFAYLQRQQRIDLVSRLFGLIIMLIGIYLWYIKIQKYDDKKTASIVRYNTRMKKR